MLRKLILIFLVAMSGITAKVLQAAESSDPSAPFAMDASFVQNFAREWIDAWNAHDLPRILSHYEEGFEMSSPAIRSLVGEPSGKLRGKESIGAYWQLALDRNPGLRFDLLHTLVGAQSITLVYTGVRGLSAEIFLLSPSGKIAAAYAHYLNEP